MHGSYEQSRIERDRPILEHVSEPRWQREARIEKALICAVFLVSFAQAIWAISPAQ